MYCKKQDGDAFIKRYCNGSLTDRAAFACGDKITIEFCIREGIKANAAFFYLGNDSEVIISQQLFQSGTEDGYTVFAIALDSEKITAGKRRGLFFYHFEADTDNGRIFTCTDGVNCTLEHKFCNEWQLTVYSEEFAPPAWLDGGVIYQIFCDRFAKSDSYQYKKPDAVYNDDWENGIPEFPEKQGDEFPNNTHFGGSLYGAAEKLDYLSALGVTCIYLNPVFEAFSNHKYDTGDYLKVDKTFGGDEALAYFIKKAGEKNISIILDGVFNHVGADSIYFNKYGKYDSVGAYQSKVSPYFDWFSFRNYPDEYDSWWGVKNLPKIKRNEHFDSFICDVVIPKYMKMGIAGWRLDVVDELSREFTERIVQSIKKEKPDAVIIGEVWEDASNKIAYNERKEYFLGRQLDSVTNYPIRNAIIDFFMRRDSTLLKLTLQTLYEHYPEDKLSHIMNIVGTHDTERILTLLGDEEKCGADNAELSTFALSAEKRRKAIKMLKDVYLLLAFLPGIPCIYYGDETGMEGCHDPFNRKPFPWNLIETELHDRFAEVNKLRATEPLFRASNLRIFETGFELFAAERYAGDESILLCANLSEKTAGLELNKKRIDNTDFYEYNQINAIPAQSVRIYKKAADEWKLLIC